MPELPIAVERESESIVTEGRLEVEITTLAHTDLELVLRPCVRHDLPIMDPIREALVRDDRSEQVLLLLKEERSVHGPHLDDI